ncbi:MAG: helix-turn-helix domain-containing protein [Anaerolineales bacterium]|nr:helix-turn-helix domain-containing protein [Anaerolineales bacterium]
MKNQAITIRTRKLGVLIRDARLVSGKSLEQCAEILHLTKEDIASIEEGKKHISLPELELLSFYLQVPLDHFWGTKVKSLNSPLSQNYDIEKITILRNRIISISLRKTREDAGITLDALSETTGIKIEKLEIYETGKVAIPIPELEVITSSLRISMNEITEQKGPIGNWLVEQRLVQQLHKMPDGMQDFISKPINQPYLELAMRLSEMSVSKLREVAEGLLEITL